MKLERITLAAGMLALLVGCGTSPAPRYFTLGDSSLLSVPQGRTPSIVIAQTNLPELIDRPQLVLRQADNRVRIDEWMRWAEPLRRDIPRVLADELGRLLDSGRVLSLPVDGQGFDADFRLLLDVQRLEAVEGQGAQVDIVWRLVPRQGKPIFGRSTLRESSVSNEPEQLVAAQRRALKAVAEDIARQVRLTTANKS